MADITMCVGMTKNPDWVCADRDKCYRHTAPQNPNWQSWFVAVPKNVDGVCEMFWRNDNDELHGS